LPSVKAAVEAYRQRNQLKKLNLRHVSSRVSELFTPKEFEHLKGRMRMHLIVRHELKEAKLKELQAEYGRNLP